MTDKRYTKDGDYLSKAAVLDLNERHGWLAYGDAQSDASNAFANNAVHSFLESAKQAQEVLGETGLTPRQLVAQRDALAKALEKSVAALSTCTPGDISTGHVIHPYFDEEQCGDAEDAARAALALVKGEPK